MARTTKDNFCKTEKNISKGREKFVEKNINKGRENKFSMKTCKGECRRRHSAYNMEIKNKALTL